MSKPEFYTNKLVLAPMVKAGRTPLRCLALEYGADLVYTEEIIDHKLLACSRKQNDSLNTIDYRLKDELVLRIAKEEQSQCVLQVGSCSPENLVAISELVKEDVAAIDVNMGCPKPFSVSGGMGAALLKKPELVKQMLTSLVSASTIPVSCKIRVLDSMPETLAFVDMVQKCGVSAIGVHGRRQNERPRDENRQTEIAEVARFVSVPVIASGESSKIRSHEGILESREKCGCSSIMLAREALTHPSVFRSTGEVLNFDEEVSNFLAKVCKFDEPFTQTKYVMQRILGGQQEFDPRGRATVNACTVEEICKAWGQEDLYYRYNDRRAHSSTGQSWKSGRLADVDEVEMTELSIPPKRLRLGGGGSSPKCVILKFCKETHLSRPTYRVKKREADGKFDAVVTIGGRHFGSTVAQMNKKMAEQVASTVALHALNLRNLLSGTWES